MIPVTGSAAIMQYSGPQGGGTRRQLLANPKTARF
tara:strand:+ start:366 stop:470 length:105 start_codon:yes stop_codon:yes gene_type:complete